VAVTAGASAPEVLVQHVVDYLRDMGYGTVDEVEVMPENVRFGLPRRSSRHRRSTAPQH